MNWLKPIKLPSNRSAHQAQPISARATGRQFDVNAAGSTTEIVLFDSIGPYGVTAAAFNARLKSAKGDIVLKINSPGGDVFDGIAIFNDLQNYKGEVQVEICGVAASAASLIAMAGDVIRICSNGFLMVHRAWALTVGNKSDHEATAGLLASIDGALAATYSARSGQEIADVADFMEKETWFGADEAVAAGFADEVVPDANVSARFDLSAFRRVPTALKGEPPPRTFRNAVEFERTLRDNCGLSRSVAARVASVGYAALAEGPNPEIERQLEQLAAQIAAATTKLEQIRSQS